MPEHICTMYEKCKFLSIGYISALIWTSVLIKSKNVCLWFKVIANDTNNISYRQVWFGRESSVGEEFALHADICNLGSLII